MANLSVIVYDFQDLENFLAEYTNIMDHSTIMETVKTAIAVAVKDKEKSILNILASFDADILDDKEESIENKVRKIITSRVPASSIKEMIDSGKVRIVIDE